MGRGSGSLLEPKFALAAKPPPLFPILRNPLRPQSLGIVEEVAELLARQRPEVALAAVLHLLHATGHAVSAEGGVDQPIGRHVGQHNRLLADDATHEEAGAHDDDVAVAEVARHDRIVPRQAAQRVVAAVRAGDVDLATADHVAVAVDPQERRGATSGDRRAGPGLDDGRRDGRRDRDRHRGCGDDRCGHCGVPGDETARRARDVHLRDVRHDHRRGLPRSAPDGHRLAAVHATDHEHLLDEGDPGAVAQGAVGAPDVRLERSCRRDEHQVAPGTALVALHVVADELTLAHPPGGGVQGLARPETAVFGLRILHVHRERYRHGHKSHDQELPNPALQD